MTDESKRYDGKRHDGPSRSSPYPVSRLAPVHDLVDIAREIERAHTMVSTVAGSKLQVIAEQIQALQVQARQILEKAQQDTVLHQAVCHFRKRPGQMYHLYCKGDGQRYLSLLSPEDWSGNPPHIYQGSYRLEADGSWTPEDQVATHTEPERWLSKLLLSDPNATR